MRIHLLIAATLAASGCGISSISGCDPPEEDFERDVKLSERQVTDLLAELQQSDPAQLVCEDVCRSVYSADNPLSANPQGFTFDNCTLTIDGELTGDPAHIVGALKCDGHAIAYYCEGRRPLGHIEHPLADPGLPAYLAHCAHLEAASVRAFEQLAERLTAWHAPAPLIARCRHAAADEAVHAALLGALARRDGATVHPPGQHEHTVDLAAAARDNAIAGCVHEAWSALTCAASARHAATPELRAIYTRLAADEAEHAQLAWDLHTWFMGQVSADQRDSIRAAQLAAIADLPALAGDQARAAPTPLARPDRSVAARFAAGLARAA